MHEFGGGHRFVADYLSDEVLRALDPDSRAFISQAAVLRRFTPALCDGVLNRTDSAAVLAELERSNLFVRRLERGDWYSIHSLFAEYCALQSPRRTHTASTRVRVHMGEPGRSTVFRRTAVVVERFWQLLVAVVDELSVPRK